MCKLLKLPLSVALAFCGIRHRVFKLAHLTYKCASWRLFRIPSTENTYFSEICEYYTSLWESRDTTHPCFWLTEWNQM